MKNDIKEKFDLKFVLISVVLALAALAAGILIGKFVLVSPAPQGNFSGEMKMEYQYNFDDMGASAVERKGDHGDSPYFNDVDFYNAQSTDSLYILPHFQKNNCHSGILTNWNHIFSSNLHVFTKLPQNLFPNR